MSNDAGSDDRGPDGRRTPSGDVRAGTAPGARGGSDPDGATDPRVEVWMRERSLPPDDPREAVVSRLRDLVADGKIADLSVHVWGRRVAVPDGATDGADAVRERLAEFRAWAERTGHSLDPAFDCRERSTPVSDERRTVVVLPTQCLGVYDGDRLVGVYPCSTADGTRTVRDCVRRLGGGRDHE